MAKLTLEPFRLEHLDAFPAVRDAVAAEGRTPCTDFAYTARLDGVVVACGGLQPLRTGVGEVWCCAVDPLPCRVGFARGVHGLLARVMRESGCWRVQAVCLASRPDYARFLEWLGFTREGTLRAYGPARENFLGYALIRED